MLAGWLPRRQRSRNDPDRDDTPLSLGDDAAASEFGTVTVESVSVQRSIVYHHLWWEFNEPVAGRMLVRHGQVEGDATPEFRARLDGEPVDSAEHTRLNRDGRIDALSVPVGSADDAVRFPVPAGETVTQTVRDSTLDSRPPDAESGHEIAADTRTFSVNCYPGRTVSLPDLTPRSNRSSSPWSSCATSTSLRLESHQSDSRCGPLSSVRRSEFSRRHPVGFAGRSPVSIPSSSDTPTTDTNISVLRLDPAENGGNEQ